MLPYEVVARREAHGSYLKRNPHFAKGQLFPQLIVEFFLKTKDKNWKGKPLVCDDPLMIYAEGASQIRLFNPAKPMQGQEPFLVLPASEVFSRDDEWKIFPEMRRIARHAFLVLEKAWQLEGGTLVDFKVEFGFDPKGRLLLADVIDNDSWRVIENGSYIDKQVYRDGGALDDVAAKYRRVAEITGRFQLPRQRIILWRGSETDKTEPFSRGARRPEGSDDGGHLLGAQGAGHAAAILHRMVQEVPDSVVIAYIGRSNGAGPTLSAMSTIPVITVPASIKDFPEDVWSSLRAPSNVPVMTVLEPRMLCWPRSDPLRPQSAPLRPCRARRSRSARSIRFRFRAVIPRLRRELGSLPLPVRGEGATEPADRSSAKQPLRRQAGRRRAGSRAWPTPRPRRPAPTRPRCRSRNRCRRARASDRRPRRATRSSRSATTSGCSTKLVSLSITPATRT